LTSWRNARARQADSPSGFFVCTAHVAYVLVRVTRLSSLLSWDGDGVIDIVEFVEGVNKLKGDVKKSDLHMLIRQNCKVLNAIQEFIDLVAQCTSPAG